MQPGLARAVPMGIVGFAIGALIAIAIRLIQGLDPNPEQPLAYVGPAMVLGAFIASGFFVWGMGAFDPKMNIHGEHHAPEPTKTAESPMTILQGFTWQVGFWTIIVVLGIAAFAFLPAGPTIRSVGPNEGNVASIGYVSLGQIYNPVKEFVRTATAVDILPAIADNLASIQLSYLTLFVFFVFWTLLSLFAVAGLIGLLINYFSRGRTNPQGTSIPWRAIIFIGLVASLLPLPLVITSRVVPMAMLMPAYVLPQLVLFIVYRRPIWLILLLVALPLPMLVPSVNLDQMVNVMGALIGVAILVILFSLAQHALPESLGRRVAFAAYTVLTVGIVVLTINLTRSDFWQLWFLLFMVVVSIGLIMPVPFLKAITPTSLWEGAAATDWPMVVPRFAGWLAKVLRHGLPSFLGQK